MVTCKAQIRRGDKSVARSKAEGQPRIPCTDHDLGNLSGRKVVEGAFRTGTAKPPQVKRQTSGEGLFCMGT